MNAYYLHKPDGTQLGASACGKCGRIACSGNFDISERCCTCYECGKPLNGDEGTAALYHRECDQRRRSQFEAARLEKAELVEDYDDPVFCDGAGHGSYGDGYFADVEELADAVQSRFLPGHGPEFAHCCEKIPFSGLDLDSILENATEDMFEDARDHLDGVEELRTAIHGFNQLNKNLCSWTPDYKRKVRLPTPA